MTFPISSIWLVIQVLSVQLHDAGNMLLFFLRGYMRRTVFMFIKVPLSYSLKPILSLCIVLHKNPFYQYRPLLA